METLESSILQHRFFKDMNPNFLPYFLESAKPLQFKPQQIIFEESTEAEHLYLIEWGCVGIEAHIYGKRPVIVQRIGVGEALGWSWFFPPYTWRFSARSLDTTEIIAFDAAALRNHVLENHEFGYDMWNRVGQVMQDRLRAARELLADCCE